MWTWHVPIHLEMEVVWFGRLVLILVYKPIASDLELGLLRHTAVGHRSGYINGKQYNFLKGTIGSMHVLHEWVTIFHNVIYI